MADIFDAPNSATQFSVVDGNSYFGLDRNDGFTIKEDGSGLIDGGTGYDTVFSRFGDNTIFSLSNYVFANVERLVAPVVAGTVTQLNSFTDFAPVVEGGVLNYPMQFYVFGTGTLDLRDDMGIFSARVDASQVGPGFVFYGDRNNDIFWGSPHADKAVGGAGDDILHGGDGDDQLFGGDGNDTIIGSDSPTGGNDLIEAGPGDDIVYVHGNGGKVNGGSGTDTVRSNHLGTVNFTFVEVLEIQWGGSIEERSVTAHLNQLRSFDTFTQPGAGPGHQLQFFLVGPGSSTPFDFAGKVPGHGVNVNATALTSGVRLGGTSLDDIFTGTAFNDTLEGGDGSDTLHGEGGNDTLRGGDGEDYLYGGAGRDSLFGGEGIDRLFGGADDDILDGGTGADWMYGGLGNDIYHVDDPADQVWDEGAGTDTVIAAVSFTLAHGNAVENLTLSEEGGAIDGTGNELRNVITGNGFANVLDGLAGADTMRGLGGDDTYFVDNSGDRVFEDVGGGTDEVRASVSYTLTAGQEIEKLSTTDEGGTAPLFLTGNEFAQTIVGNAGANRLDGRGGADTMEGLRGNDIYYVDHPDDRVVEGPGAGTDTVHASHGYRLEAGQHIEYLRANAGTTGLELIGNEFANYIFGGAGDDTLEGGAGADRLTGNAGRDIFAYYAAADSTVSASDMILDFTPGEDVIWLRFDGNASADGHQELLFAGQVNGVVANSVTWVESGNNTIVRADINGDSIADFRLIVVGTNLQLDADDFYFGIPG